MTSIFGECNRQKNISFYYFKKNDSQTISIWLYIDVNILGAGYLV